MRTLAAFTALILLTTMFGCNKLKHIPFDYTYHSSVSVPQESVPGITDSFSAVVPTNIDSIMAHYGTKPDLLESAKLSALTMTITAPPGQNFGFVRDIRVLIVTPSGDVEIASKHNISTTSSALDIDVDNVELKPYLTAQNMTLKVIATTAMGTTTAMTISFDMKVHFEANLLAIF